MQNHIENLNRFNKDMRQLRVHTLFLRLIDEDLFSLNEALCYLTGIDSKAAQQYKSFAVIPNNESSEYKQLKEAFCKDLMSGKALIHPMVDIQIFDSNGERLKLVNYPEDFKAVWPGMLAQLVTTDFIIDWKMFIDWAKLRGIELPAIITNKFKLTPTTPHGNTINNAIKRQEILGAAVALLFTYKNKYPTITELQKAIEEKAPLFWPQTGEPPLGSRTISELLSNYISLLK